MKLPPNGSEIAAYWTPEGYYLVQRQEWYSADGDEWTDAAGLPADTEEFRGARITLVGGPRDAEIVG